MMGVTKMEDDNLSEGLFLKNYLGTVSAVSRPRTSALMETKPFYCHGEYGNQKVGHSPENGMFSHARVIYEFRNNNESETTTLKNKLQNEVFQRNSKNHGGITEAVQMENEEEKEKKKDRKWTLGGLFRRKNKKDADDSSEDSEGEDNKKGFLSRRRSKREKRKSKVRANTNGFDVVIPQVKESAKNGEISVEQLWSGDRKLLENGPVRYIHRHPEAYKTANSLQIPKHCRRDSRSSGGSENADGRKGRKEVMARAEAKRDMMRDDSSSDEFDSYHSTSSLNRVNGECRKSKRHDRQKRLSKDEDSQTDLRMIKSDFEGGSRRLPPNCRWISKAYYADSSEHEAVKLNLLNHSGTSSPCRSPRARQKQLLNYMMQNSYPTSTFPPVVHHQQVRSGTSSPARIHHAKENQNFIPYKNQSYRPRNSEYNLTRSISNTENTNRRTLLDYEQFLNSCGSTKEKSLSYDQNIHRASYFENEPEISRNCKRVNGSELLINHGRGADIYNQGSHPAVKTNNGTIENRTDSTPSLQCSGIFPSQPAPNVHRSTSGNYFCERNFHPNRSSSYQHIPTMQTYYSRVEKSPTDNIYSNLPSNSLPSKSHISESPSILRYYADQNPRSRNPIHITCNPTTPENPYLSDSQVAIKPMQSVRKSASDFWKLKEQEVMKQKRISENSLKPPQTCSRSRSSSPNRKEDIRTVVMSEVIDNKKTLKEESNSEKVCETAPEPPVRRLSKQEVFERLKKCEELKNQEKEIRINLKNDAKVHSSNLDEALNELEMIYNSLRLKDEDLVDRAERRDLPVYKRKNPVNSVSVRDKIQNFYAETNYSKNSDPTAPNGHQRAIPLRRSGVPDKMADDMAFRRLNQKDRADTTKVPPQSYLRSSPALSPPPNGSPTFRRESPVLEPDITYDDVVFRNFRHANSTLKVQDPQPPFGIPIGVVAPAPNSDYLHATPTERFRPTFTSSKIPDVVKDDLAFRNLRKDNKTITGLEPKNELKKRAVRSLSANLYSIMQKDNPTFIPMETNNNVVFEKNCEKTQSLTDLTKGKQALEKRLKELKEENQSKRAEFFDVSQVANNRSPGDLNWTELANLKRNFEDVIHKRPKNLQQEDSSRKFRSPVVELSKYPAAAPSSTLQGNPFKEPSLVDEEQLESLLSALAREAENASKDLEKQLDQLETRKPRSPQLEVEESKERAIEEFNKKFKTSDKSKRRRNLSLSNANESKEEIRKTGSLERRRKIEKPTFPFEEVLRGKSKASTPEAKVEKSQNKSFEMINDLSQILHDVEIEQRLNNNISQRETNTFQEVYEYNCKLSTAERRKSGGYEEPVEVMQEVVSTTEAATDLEKEFDKIHEEVNNGEETKGTDLDDLMADIVSVEPSLGDSYGAFPFPNDSGTASSSGPCGRRDGTSPGSSKGEGLCQSRSRTCSSLRQSP